VAERARRLPWVPADAEAVLQLRPDLVLAGHFAARNTAFVLEQLGVRMVFLDEVRDFAAIRAETRRMGALLDAGAAAEAWIGEMDRALPRHAPTGKRAIMWEARGWTSGPGSLGDAVLRAAGYDNAGTGGQMGLERLLAAPPDLLVVEQAPRFPSLATDLVRHPSLADIPRKSLPPALLICGTPDTARAVALLVR
jgi:iron complex transport system substrate-binding protein